MFSQHEKNTIYINFNTEVKNCQYKDLKLKWFKKEGLQFNLCGKGVFLFKNAQKSDTLNILKLDDYPITTMEEVDQKVKDFRYKKYGKRPLDENDKAYQFYNKNDIFRTYLIEVIGDCKIVIYPVIWRNQDIID